MSEDFFERYNALNRSLDAEQKEDAAAPAATDTANGETAQATQPVVNTPREAVAPSAPAAQESAVQRPAQQSGWQSGYYHYSVPVARPTASASSYNAGTGVNTGSGPSANTNPYAARPDSAAQPAPRAASPSSSTPSKSSGSPYASSNNTYVDRDGYYHRSFTEHRANPSRSEAKPAPARTKVKKEKSGISKGTIAVLMVVCILVSGVAGFCGSLIASSVNPPTTTVVTETVTYDSTSTPASKTADKDTDVITKEVADSVVEITTEVVQTSGYYGQYISTGAGSGVIISDDGYIVTNNHVIEDATTITVTLRSGKTYDALLIGTDPQEDVALIKIEADDLTVATFGDSNDLEVGDKAIIIGNPLGTLGGSVTEGIVSALDRSIVIDGKTMHLMQTDAAINPGNSGGGMFNGQGELVGIVVAKSSGTTSSGSTIDNIGFVIPINNVLNILGDLKQYGYVRGKADTGMDFVDISNEMYAWYYFGSTSTGVFISSVDRGSNAYYAGFQVGDRVISVDGKKVSSASDISDIIASHSVGDTITFELERSGKTGSLELTLEEYEP